MDSNRDDAERCVRIARAAMDSGDLVRAWKFVSKAQRLYPTPEIDALFSRLKKEGADQGENGKDEAGSRKAATNPDNGTKEAANGFHRVDSTSSLEATVEQIEIVRKINKTKDYYEILGLAKGCAEEEVRKAYRKLSLKVHPDKNKAAGAEEAFKAVSKAFQCLSDAELREKYDQYGPEEARNQAAQQQGMRRRRYNGAYYDEEFDPNEIFNAFFYGMQNQNGMFRRAHFVHTPGQRGGQQGTEVRSANYLGIVQLLAVLALFVLSSIPFSQPIYSLEAVSPYQYRQTTKDHGVNYYVRSASFDQDYPVGSSTRRNVEAQVERDYKEILLHNCRIEWNMQRWGQIADTPNCKKLEKFQRVY
ncbi:hypothetical protein O6H91_20G019000 [Diphasiastrum complanatum]|uniref:Uncharacterized protein n=1 Tax=Diphasiastrum complanatum TaxID=34168 RepID=A0ACC2APX7_DIPCM|nr:hypothetical protein O6H91_20G019000 [Diphasiastrum complanatum]